jgi:predicted ATPase/DNA-binding SARP family transcriptional activator/Tfp pilus assembly protein PilF
MATSDPPVGVHVTYTQQFRRCGKPDCAACTPGKPGHGPYWYAYWRQDGRVRTRYLGRRGPPGAATATVPFPLAPSVHESPSSAQTAAASVALRVQTLGAFRVWIGTQAVPAEAWTRRRAGSLFKSLLGSPEYRLHREQALELLWPDAAPTVGAANLRGAIHRLRKILDRPAAPSHLQPEREWLVLAPSPLGPASPDWLDAATFVAAAKVALDGRDPASCRAALARYGGEYLPDDRYAEWAIGRREMLARQRLALLVHLADLSAAQGMAREAIRCLQEVLKADPCNELAARALMQLHGAGGRRGEAIEVYRSLTRALKDELGLRPEPETLALYRAVRLAATPEVEAMPTGSPVAARQPPSNLPAPLTRFIGREAAIAEITELLAGGGPGRRLLTLIGGGGCGKTRLALEVARGLMPAYPDGVWLVDLAALPPDPSGDSAAVVRAAAVSLGLREQAQYPLLEVLTDYLRSRRILLVLDNCEHLLAACAEMAATMLVACGELQIMATSRHALDVPGEIWWRVPSLTYPLLASHTPESPAPSHRDWDPADWLQFEAVRLFAERARARQPNAFIAAGQLRGVAQICGMLDGIPLAIELAAACLPALSVEEIAAGLESRFQLLTGGSRVVLPRHRTLRAMLDWSYALLDVPEQTLLRRISVFAGGWTLEAATAVCAGTPIAADGVEDLLSRLVAASLIHEGSAASTSDGRRRYGMLETIRQYGRELLDTTGESGSTEATITRERHWDWCMALGDQVASAFGNAVQGSGLDQLEVEHDNLRAALAWSLTEPRSVRDGLSLAATLWRFWYVRGHFREGRHWLESLLARDARQAVSSPAPKPGAYQPAAGEQRSQSSIRPQDSSRARALTGAGSLAFIQGDLVRARALQEECLALYRSLGSTFGIAAALHNLADVLYRLGDLTQSVALHEEALVLQRQLGRKDLLAAFLNSLGNALFHQGHYARAAPLFEESLVVCRELEHVWGATMVLRNLGLLAQAQRRFDQAATFFEESLALSQQLGSAQDTIVALNDLGAIAACRGEYERAATLHAESLALAQKLGDRWSIANVLQSQANLAQRQGDFPRAATGYRESLALAVDLGSKEGICENLEGLARVYALQDQSREPARAARLFGAAAGLRESSGAPLTPAARHDYEQALATLREALGETALAALWAAGAAMPIDDVVAQVAHPPSG